MEDLQKRVEIALEEIRPFLQGDGGDISIISIEKNIVYVKLHGNCLGCSVNQMTLKSGVELTVQKYAPEILKVVDVDA